MPNLPTIKFRTDYSNQQQQYKRQTSLFFRVASTRRGFDPIFNPARPITRLKSRKMVEIIKQNEGERQNKIDGGGGSDWWQWWDSVKKVEDTRTGFDADHLWKFREISQEMNVKRLRVMENGKEKKITWTCYYKMLKTLLIFFLATPTSENSGKQPS